jgi:hypothetical protein
MRWIAWLAIVPFCIASLVTGIVQSLATPWGLFRHYGVVVKLLSTAVATALLLLHPKVIDYAAQAALVVVVGVDSGRVRVQLVADAAAGLVALLMATILAVYKPRGLTAHGRRTARRLGSVRMSPESPAPQKESRGDGAQRKNTKRVGSRAGSADCRSEEPMTMTAYFDLPPLAALLGLGTQEGE